MRVTLRWIPTFVLLALVTLVGCGKEIDEGELPLTAEDIGMTGSSSGSMVLTERPSGEAMTPTDVKEQATGELSVVIAGKIHAGEMDPFQPGEVTFMISQLPDEGHGADDPDHADNCPFCKRKLENAPKAIVQFRDASGSVMAGDARQLLSIDKGDVVVVTGTATYNAAVDTVMVNATGVYRQPPEG